MACAAMNDVVFALGIRHIYILGGERTVHGIIAGKSVRFKLTSGMCIDQSNQEMKQFYIYGFLKRHEKDFPELMDKRVSQAAADQVVRMSKEKISIPEE